MKSIASRIIPIAAVAVTLFSLSGTARADALPPDACQALSDVGQACQNAGEDNDQPGVCAASTCHSASPPDGGSDYACARCTNDGTPTDGGTSDGGQATTVRDDAGTAATPGSSSSSGCSASPDTSDGAAGFALLALGIVGLAFGRRRKS